MFFIIFLVLLLIVAVILGVGMTRANKTNYRHGEGLFKSSEFNLDEQEDVADKTYYDDNNGLFR